jgi:NADH-quinone oxidoreductase subunit N
MGMRLLWKQFSVSSSLAILISGNNSHMFTLYEIDFVFAVGEIYLLWVGLLLLLIGLLKCTYVILRLVGFVLGIELLFQLDTVLLPDVIVWNYHWKIDAMGNFCSLLMCIILLLLVGSIGKYIKLESVRRYELFLLFFWGFYGLLCLLKSNDLVLFYLNLEWYSLCMYILASIGRVSNLGTEAGLKYYVLGALSSGFFLYGFSIWYGLSGVTIYQDIDFLLVCGAVPIIHFGFFFICVGLLLKLGVVPFHIWVPDVYEGSSTLVTMFFSLIPKIGLLGSILKIVMVIYAEYYLYNTVLLGIVICLSILIGTLCAVFQTKIKRLLAYSSIVHSGYLLVPIMLSTFLSMMSFLFYIVLYELMVLNVFNILIGIRGKVLGRLLKLIVRLGVLVKGRGFVGLALLMSVLSLAGFPPFAGFYSKLYLFIVAMEDENYLLFFVMIVATLISAIYYLRLIRMLCFMKVGWYNVVEYESVHGLGISFISHFLLFFTFYNMPIMLVTYMGVGGY